MVLLKEMQVGLSYKTDCQALFSIFQCSVSVFSQFQGDTYWKKSVDQAASQVPFKQTKLLWRKVSFSDSVSEFFLSLKQAIRKRGRRNGSRSPQINEGNILPLEKILTSLFIQFIHLQLLQLDHSLLQETKLILFPFPFSQWNCNDTKQVYMQGNKIIFLIISILQPISLRCIHCQYFIIHSR